MLLSTAAFSYAYDLVIIILQQQWALEKIKQLKFFSILILVKLLKIRELTVTIRAGNFLPKRKKIDFWGTSLDLRNPLYHSSWNSILHILVLEMRAQNEIFKVSYSGNGPEIDSFVNLSNICLTWKNIREYWIQYCMSYVHDLSILGNFLPARMVGVG